jgi:hypothetical protein
VKGFGSIPIVVNIAQTSAENNQRSYGFSEHLRKYNKTIEELALKYGALLINAYIFSESGNILLAGGTHLNNLGSTTLASEIAEAIRQPQDGMA